MQSPQPRRTVFISYSHKDKNWLDRLQVHLKPLERDGLFDRWDDTRIKPGSKWRDEIKTALKSAKVAILLISADFLASDFIAQNELPPLLAAAETNGALIIPVIIGPCSIPQNLAQFQYINARLKREEKLAEVAKAVENAVQSHERSDWCPPNPQPNLPPRNPLFTGRTDILTQTEQALRTQARAALSGLGGAGKTATAIEYAHLHESEYEHIFWVGAATRESLISDYARIAPALGIPEAKDQTQTVESVKRELTQRTKWLLILDNADDIEMARPFIPGQSGHVLLTTRAHSLGTLAECIDVKEMAADEAIQLLLRRAKIRNPTESDRKAAREIAITLLAGLPLALDQAGAYIEETQCGLEAYIQLYKKHAPDLLKRRGMAAHDHPDPVATTWALSFEKIEKANPAAADLLRFCAFLSPDAIPEELLATQLPDEFEFNNAISEILKYSLLTRDPNSKTIEIHRLVQEAIKLAMSADQKREWAERTVRTVNQGFPSFNIEFHDWPTCERLLPQALACAQLITDYNLEFQESALLMNQAGLYLDDRARYAEAEALFQRSLAIRERVLGPNHRAVATSLNNLAALYYVRSEYSKAEPLLQRSLAILEKALGLDHPDVAQSLNNVAALYRARGEYSKAEPLFQRSLTIKEKAHGPDHPDIALTLNNLAALYLARGEYDKAEPLFQRSLAICEKALSPDHPDVGQSLNYLAALYYSRGEYLKAEPLYQRSLAIKEKALGDHPSTANTLENYANLLAATDRPAQAAELRARAAAIRAKFPPQNPDHNPPKNTFPPSFQSLTRIRTPLPHTPV